MVSKKVKRGERRLRQVEEEWREWKSGREIGCAVAWLLLHSSPLLHNQNSAFAFAFALFVFVRWKYTTFMCRDMNNKQANVEVERER